MKFSKNSQKGYVGAMLVVAIAVIVGIMIVGITHKMGDLTKSYDKSKAFFDSEVAIEKFSVALKNAYDRANYLADQQPETAGSATLNDYGCPGKLVTIGNAVRLCWDFNGGGNLCVKRSREAGGPPDICLDQQNLQVRYVKSDEWEVVMTPQERSPAEKWELFKEAAFAYMKDLGIAKAEANLDAFKPGLPAVSSTNSIVLDTTARSKPEAPDCTVSATNPFQCLKVSFCVKIGACGADDLIRQTYLFAKPATSSLGF